MSDGYKIFILLGIVFACILIHHAAKLMTQMPEDDEEVCTATYKTPASPKRGSRMEDLKDGLFLAAVLAYFKIGDGVRWLARPFWKKQ